MIKTILLIMTLLLAAVSASRAENVSQKLDAYMRANNETQNFSGSVLVAKDSTVLLRKGYGMANYELGAPNTPRTKFEIASLTKAFTAVLALQLVEQGKLKLDGKVTDYLPDYPQDPGGSITIHELLANTSGLPHYDAIPDFFERYGRTEFSESEYVALFSKLPVVSKPGAAYHYSSFGYYLLGVILEKVSGKPYANLLRDQILAPLGMRDTSLNSAYSIEQNRASGYDYVFDYKNDPKYQGLANAPFSDVSSEGAAGQVLSTVEDLYKWNFGLRSTKLLRTSSRKLLFQPNMANYGYGWNIRTRENKTPSGKTTVAHHGGSAIGFSSYLSMNLDNGVFVVVLSNRSNAPTPNIEEDLEAIVYGDPYSMPKRMLLPASDGNVTFTLSGNQSAKKVCVSGEFNNWNPWQTYLTKQADQWVAKVPLAKGVYKYMFVVDGKWIPDPANPLQDKGSFTSSILTVK